MFTVNVTAVVAASGAGALIGSAAGGAARVAIGQTSSEHAMPSAMAVPNSKWISRAFMFSPCH
ncbi:MAG: hypothetical protein E6J26_05835 [Chloroflexi bacterium]|nr:MAG: hypothetical protein E6J26_05835 [Chloroflexota bacterium]